MYFHLFAYLSLYLYLCVGGGTCVTLSLARRVYEPEPDLNSHTASQPELQIEATVSSQHVPCALLVLVLM